MTGDAPPTIELDGARWTRVLWREHSGQRIPTGVDVMQSGHIGLSQFEHATFVSLPGCL